MKAQHWTLGPLGPLGPSGAAPVDTGEVSTNITQKGYTLGRTLGSGRFSQVLHGKHVSGAEFAVKVIEKDEDVESLEALRVEVAVLKATDHPNIVQLHEVVRTPSSTYLVMELLRGGELFDTIVERGCFTEPEAKRVLRQLLSAVAHCHGLGIVHRDLKPENLLFSQPAGTEGPEGEAQLKIIDFGYAALLEPGRQLRGLSGTPDYAAPEVLSWCDGDIEGVEYGASADMWSVGVVAFILLCGFPPFYAEEEEQLLRIVRSGHYEFAAPYWDNVSQEAMHFELGAKPIFGPAPSREELTLKGAKFVTLPRALFDEMYTLCEAQRQGAGGQDVREQFATLMQTVSLQAGRGELGRVQET